MSKRVHNTPLEQAIYKVMCDEAIFYVGFKGTAAKIAGLIMPELPDEILQDCTTKLYRDSVSQVLETRCNCIRNDYITKSKSELLKHPKDYYNTFIQRDIAMVKIDLKSPYGHNLYIFGCIINDVIDPLEQDRGWLL